MKSVRGKSKKNRAYEEISDTSSCTCKQTTLYSSIFACLLLVIVYLNFSMMNSLDNENSLRSSHVFQIIPEKLEALEASVRVPDGFFSNGDWKQWLADGLVHMNEEIAPLTTSTTSAISSEDKKKEEDDDDVFDKKTENSGNTILNSDKPFKFAYTTLISGLDSSYKYRGFLYNALIMKESLEMHGSTADFIAMIALNNPQDEITFKDDIDLLKEHGILVHILERLVQNNGAQNDNKLGFAEMALLKVTPWNFKEYSRVQFLDGDVMPTSNMDCYFELNRNTFTVGAVSPLNSGWYMAIPDASAYDYLISKALDRLHRDWDIDIGWGDKLPDVEGVSASLNNKAQSNLLAHSKKDVVEKRLYVRGRTKSVTKWDFNGADMDQGLLCQYFILKHGNGVLVDTVLNTATIYEVGYLSEDKSSNVYGDSPESSTPGGGGGMIVFDTVVSTDPHVARSREYLMCCNGESPVSKFIHFTGKSKPWMNIPSVESIQKYMQRNPETGRDEINFNSALRNGNKPLINHNMLLWLQMLDRLQLKGVDSLSIGGLGLSSPLGFFNANFPKGGFKKKALSNE